VKPGSWLVAVDVGGTFTDAVAVGSSGETLVAKVPSSPSDPAVAFERAVRELQSAGLPLERTMLAFHGTTVATNAVLTEQLARVVLVVTEGFADLLSYRDGTRPIVYDLHQRRPSELVARRDRVEVRERLSSRGTTVEALTDEEVDRVVEAVASRRPEAVAVALLFSFLDDAHERRLVRALEGRLGGIPVVSSAASSPEMREYPRTTTAVLNAGLRPIVGRYVVDTERRLRDLGLAGELMIMQSNGGCVPASRADAEAHRLLLSGPAAGVAGTVALGAAYGLSQLVSFDMGGTSLDVCLIHDGHPPVTPIEHVGGHPILCPSVDMVTIGAGGGSIAEVDSTGRLRVGPRSAGAQPGPAAYGHGGEEATVTDAHIVLGTLPTELPLASGLRIDADAAHKAVQRVGLTLGLDARKTASGIVQVAVAEMSLALRRVSVERGIDPEGYTLVAFGGAGPLHAAMLLRELGFASVLVPRHPGLFAAAGLISTDLRVDRSKTVLERLDAPSAAPLAQWYRETANELRATLVADGIPRSAVRVVASADCRYAGQGYELQVPVQSLSRRGVLRLQEQFHLLHRSTYGHHDPTGTVEAVTVRLSAFGGLATHAERALQRAGRSRASSAIMTDCRATFPGAAEVRVPVYDRELLRAGHTFEGPAIVHQADATTLVLEGQHARVDERASLWIEEQR
jgi:N-methylhydantoinase A